MTAGRTVLLARDFERTLDALVARLSADPPPGPVEAWLFEDRAARAEAEARLAGLGIAARIRTAYKPLLAFFREEADLSGVRSAVVRYPRHPATHPDRFLLETYPLAMLLPDVAVRFEPGGTGLTYEVELHEEDGGCRRHQVFAPNLVQAGSFGRPVLVTSGWLRIAGSTDGPLDTEYAALFRQALDAVPATGVAAARLEIRADITAEDEPLGWGDEVLSLAEALHEDLFFALRERFQAGGGGNRPLQIVPDIRSGAAAIGLRITAGLPDDPDEAAGPPPAPLALCKRPLPLAEVQAALQAMGGRVFQARSVQGRPVPWLHKPGSVEPVLISAAQHGNETSGVIGALRAAAVLMRRKRAHFALIPVENVDGYALHQRLIAQNPRHMHHAARYTATGADLSASRDDERLARLTALRRSGARLHLNLHGYPAHEWTRPLSGYLPAGFEQWTIPRGFFLIVTHHPGWGRMASRLMATLARRLGADPALALANARQLATLRQHSQAQPFRVIAGIPCFLTEGRHYEAPLTVITEAPDETVHGAEFRRLHTAQMRAVLHAVAIYQKLCRPSRKRYRPRPPGRSWPVARRHRPGSARACP
ncbi:M14 family metallopeptidase [Geminicoccus harenae]|uniref:peptidase M14 n=1 Tax=Geminicoccus harenae TaxID=2498453 RepID=UPI00168A6352|nr:peptidase M14 [Geminicoccus harenae]